MLKVENLCFRRGRRWLFDRLSMELEPGHALFLTGANGTGKSTLLRLLAGLLPPLSGSIRWRGESVKEMDGQYRAEYLWLAHQSGMKAELTVEENLAFAFSLLGEEAPAKSSACWTRLGLDALRWAALGRLSSGERARVQLAPLANMARRLWLLDEPLAFLDEAGIGVVERLITEHTEGGGIVVCATHRIPAMLPSHSRFLNLEIETPPLSQ